MKKHFKTLKKVLITAMLSAAVQVSFAQWMNPMGIGTTTPAYDLDVVGTLRADTILTSDLDVSGAINTQSIFVNGSPLVPGVRQISI